MSRVGPVRSTSCGRTRKFVGMLCLLAAGALGTWTLEASEFRGFQTILTAARRLGANEVPVPRTARPLDRQAVDRAVRQVFASWNKGDMERHLGEGLFDRSRLLENVNIKVPRDAQLRLLGVMGVQSLGQRAEADPAGAGRVRLVDTVSVTAKTQMNFNDPSRGFQQIEGTNEYVFEVTRSVAR